MIKQFIIVGCIIGVKLGRGFEPLGKGLKPFAFTCLCHSSWSFSRTDGLMVWSSS